MAETLRSGLQGVVGGRLGPQVVKVTAKGYTTSAIEQFNNLGGLDELVRRMADAGARWPPTSRDWEGYGIAWEEIPTRKVLEEVSDGEVRAALHFLNETAEQRDRIKAAVLLCEILGSSPDDFLTYAILLMWRVAWLGENIAIPDGEHGGIQA